MKPDAFVTLAAKLAHNPAALVALALLVALAALLGGTDFDLRDFLAPILNYFLVNPSDAIFAALFAALIWNQSRGRQEMRQAILECREDALIDNGHLRSAMALLSSFKSIALSVFVGRRKPLPSLDDLDNQHKTLRKAIHDTHNERVARYRAAGGRKDFNERADS